METTEQSFLSSRLAQKQAILSVSEESIAFCLEPGMLMEGSFTIGSTRGERIRGRVYTTHWRMQCQSGSRFQGASCEINYLFDSTGMEYGDTIRGQFLIVSDIGEYRVPFAVTAQPRYLTTPEGKLKTLGDFVNLTQIDMDAAYQAYAHPQFLHTLRAEDEKLQRWYQGLNQNGTTYGSMLEFLRLIGHPVSAPKEPSLKTELKKYYAQSRKNGEKQERKRQVVQLFRAYLQFRSGQMPAENWISRSKELLVDLRAKGPYKDFYALGMIHMYLLEKNESLAKEQLNNFANTHYDLKKNAELYGYYLYLNVLMRRSAAFLEQVCERIRMLCEKHPGSGILLWILLMLDESLLHDPQERIRRMEQIHEAGVHTPILYIEAAMLYRQQPQLVGSLSAYEVHVLVFARRCHLLNQELMDRITKLALGCKEFSMTMYTLLMQCYKANPQKQCIHAICTLLIKGHKTGTAYFQWYRRGVEQNLRITSLYDYYLYSMEETMERPIHESVLDYFRYNQDLDYRKKSYLFANLMKFQERYPEMYDAYYNDMVDFVVRQLDKGRVNRHLIFLYQQLVNRQYIGQKNAANIADFIFSYRIQGIADGITSVIVCEPALSEEMSIPVRGGEAIVPVYSEEACLFYQAADGGRQCVTDWSKFERWFEKEELLPLCERYCPSHPGIWLRRCERLVKGEEPNWQVFLGQLTADTQLSMAFRMQVWQQLLAYFYKTYNHDAIEWCLAHIRIKELPEKNRNQNIELLLLCGSYEEAFAYISTYGCEHLSDRALVRMCSYMICKKEFLYDESCLAICREVFFRDKYDELMLSYLIDYMDGGTQELVQLWRAGQAFELDTYPVAKKLIARVLQTGYIPQHIYDIFDDYYRNCGKDNLVSAFLTYFVREALQKDMQTDRRIYDWIRRELTQGETLNETCRIGWLYGVAQDQTLLGGQAERATEILQELLLQERYFAFYATLPEEVAGSMLFAASTFLEYKTDPANHVYLHYRIADGEQTGFTVEELDQSFPGVFVKELLLFGDDVAQYYIVEQSPKEEWIAASGERRAHDCKGVPGGRFAAMQNMLETADQETVEQQLEAYLTQSYVAEQWFQKKDQ